MTDKHIVRCDLPLLGDDGSAVWTGEFAEGAQVLDAGALYGRQACLWVLEDVPGADPEPKAKRTYRLFGTGKRIPGDLGGLQFVGTAQLGGGDHVAHIFEDTLAAGSNEVSPPMPPSNGTGNDASNPPQPPADRGGGNESTPGNSPPSAPPPGTPPPHPEPQPL